MPKLDDLLYGYRCETPFLDDLKQGVFYEKKAELVKAAIQDIVDNIDESNLAEKQEVANLCKLFYQVGATMTEHDWYDLPDWSCTKFDRDIFEIISKLYPKEKEL